MAANTSPIFTLTPVIGHASIGTANTARDGSGTLGTVITGSTDGTRVSRITVQSSGSAVTAGMVRLFIETSGSTVLYHECPVTATSPSNTVAGFRAVFEYIGERAIVLPSSASIKASTAIAETFNVWAEGGNY